MSRQRIQEWEQRKALAEWMWERGPITAQFTGQMSENVAKILNKKLDRTVAFNAVSASSLIAAMVADGLVVREGTSQKPTRLTYVGPDPELKEWAPPRAPTAVAKVSELEELRERVQAVEEGLERLRTGLALSIEQAVRAEMERQLS
jgi:hypothetical protein